MEDVYELYSSVVMPGGRMVAVSRKVNNIHISRNYLDRAECFQIELEAMSKDLAAKIKEEDAKN